MNRRPLLIAALTVGLLGAAPPELSWAEEPPIELDVDAWHTALAEAVDGDLVDRRDGRWCLGLYPSAGVALGPPEWVSYRLHGAASLSDGETFSLFMGYGYEEGAHVRSHMVTIGWGGVRRLPAARPQHGFYGKFLRYRRIDDERHGRHHGLSVGAESVAGRLGVVVEVGAARSENNHWMFTAQIALKVGIPVLVPL